MTYHQSRGMTLIDTLVGTAIALIIFLAIFGLLRASAALSTLATETAAATSIAESQMEYLRSLPYDSVGTVGGIPAGTVPQQATTTEDNVGYGVRTFIEYYDDPADGTAPSDTVPTDYKLAKVTVTFYTSSGAHATNLVSTIAPPGVETTTNGGTLRIAAVDANGNPVTGATVTVANSSVSPSVNLTTYTDATGITLLEGAAAGTGYKITVTKDGYSTAQTYDRAGDNQNPNPGHLTVAKNQTTSSSFAIDKLSTLTVGTYSPVATSTWSDTFNDGTELAATSNTTAAGGVLTLSSDGAGGFLSPGSARSSAVAPEYLANWGAASASITAPAGASAVVHVTDGDGNLIPDAALPGNSTGFTSFPINLYALSTTTYPSIALSTNLSAGAGGAPSIGDWSITYAAGPTPLPNVSFTLTGAKKIGTTSGGAPIYKTTISTSTDATGFAPLSLEWDTYTLSVTGYTIATTSPAVPVALTPGATSTLDIIVTP
jgi:hypothetical protein